MLLNVHYNARLFQILCILLLAFRTNGLACYETENGKSTIALNDSWTYCVLIPHMPFYGEGKYRNGTQFGIGAENEELSAYDTAFSLNTPEYQILTLCILERYDLRQLNINLPVEFMFRCMCNYDLCNSATTFSALLSAQKLEN